MRYLIYTPDGKPINITVKRDKRLKKSARWNQLELDEITLRVPHRWSKRQFPQLVANIEKQLATPKRKRKPKSDSDLILRAQHINKKYFNNQIQFEAIKWVGNMSQRLGSCTSGGTTDGHIRISKKIEHWPDWVIDYVIAHELTHRLHPNHSAQFWKTLYSSYPLSEKAEGFIEGIGFARRG
jgi:predicted metal-dependent hydrolase